jgi:hypothetical protein
MGELENMGPGNPAEEEKKRSNAFRISEQEEKRRELEAKESEIESRQEEYERSVTKRFLQKQPPRKRTKRRAS